MADVERYERSQNRAAARGAKDAGDITDRREPSGKSNFKGPRASKSGAGVKPHASGSPWKYGREDQAERSYSADYSRKGSDAGSNVRGPKSPSPEIPGSITGGSDKGSRRSQMDHK